MMRKFIDVLLYGNWPTLWMWVALFVAALVLCVLALVLALSGTQV